MTFLAPWLLVALVGLPALWWLLRVTPPSPRRQSFPPTRLLHDLPSEQMPARTPLWLLLLRVITAALVIIGVADPILGGRHVASIGGTLAIVLDDDWAAAADWGQRIAAVDRLAAGAERDGRPALLATTSPRADGTAPGIIGPMAAADLRAVLPTLQPHPWPPDRAATARSLAALAVQPGSVAYVADGLAHGPDWPAFAAALSRTGPPETLARKRPPAALLSAATTVNGWIARVAMAPSPIQATFGVRAGARDGRVLARGAILVAAGAGSGSGTITLPTDLRNRVDRLTLEDAQGATIASVGATWLLDEAERRRPVGLLTSEAPAADAPLTGAAFFLRRALSTYAEWREGRPETLLAQPISVLLAADRPIVPGTEADTLRNWIEHGGTLIRFAGPDMAQAAQDGQADPLLPVALLPASRQMGGSMSWGKPEALAPFQPDTPFAGLAANGMADADPAGATARGATSGNEVSSSDVTVSRQVLADPAADLGSATWARLIDGTPLVTQRPLGAGRIVLFHVTANTDWSNLPLSGLFVEMLRRLLALSAGVADQAGVAGNLAPSRMLDAFGAWTAPPAAARSVAASAWAGLKVGPDHPPGLYGPDGGQLVLNLSRGQPDPQAAPDLGGPREELIEAAPSRPLGPLLLAIATIMLLVDLLVSLRARGMLVAATAAALLTMASPLGIPTNIAAHAETYDAALATRLAYIRTGDDAVDDVARAGLTGLSTYVNERTAAQLATPVGVVPGHDDLSFFPLLYWPISAEATAPDGAMVAALNAYMATGGVILIDTRDGGSGAGMADGTRDVLRRLSGGASAGGAAGVELAAPPLAPLTSTHVLARSFYLLSDFPGRYDGETVWIARDTDRSNDSVSPLIIGGHDWGAAWAVDADGQHPFALLPGGERQRTLAYRFGVNLVMYSLTGNYKGDQVHVPALLQRLGQ